MKLFPPGRRLYLRTVVILVSLIIAIGFQFERAQTAGTFTVNSLGDTSDANPGNGVCADAGGACTLRAAIEEANNTSDIDTINFSVTGTINLTGPLPEIINTNINGPGSGLLTVRRDTGGDYRIFSIVTNVQGIAASVLGLTVTNGKTADGISRPTGAGDPGGDGGGILISALSTVTLSDVVVTGNRTGNGGVSGSTTGGWGGFGGGIAASGTLIFTNVTVTNNLTGNGATGQFGGSGGGGGGIFIVGSLNMSNSIVSGNTTGDGAAGTDAGASGGGGGDGGGISIPGGGVTLTNVVITGNKTGNATSGGSGGHGGGLVLMPRMAASLVNVTVSNNTTGNGGGGTAGQGGRGGALENHGFMTITNSTLAGNKTGNAGATGGDSGGRGGAISNNGSLKVWNCTISGNSTDGLNAHGGGISQIGGGLALLSSTVTGNAASSQVGNGIYRQPLFTHDFGIGNTIVAQNIGGPDAAGDFASLGGNLIGNADGATGFSASDLKGTSAAPLDPLLGPLADNGGPTQTHALLAGSPALDAGDNSKATDPLITDQRGTGRIADSLDADTIATVDIGAYEFHPTLNPIFDRTINEDSSLMLFVGVGDIGPEVTSLTASSTSQGLLPNANVVISGSGPVRTLQATPLANLSGTTTITVTATYAGGGIVNSSFLLTVQPVNDAPTFTKGADQIVNEDSGAQTITNWATGISAGPGESGQTLSFFIAKVSNPSLFSAAPVISSTGTLTYTPAANAFGSAEVTVFLQDNGGTANGGMDRSDVHTFTITVNAVNDAPTFTKGADQTVAEDSGLVSVANWSTGISVGPANESQVVNFVVTNNTNTSLFSSQPAVSSSGTLSYLPAANANGFADISLVAQDSGGTANGGVDTSPAQTFRITITSVNDGPVNNVPLSPATNQQTPLIFSAANSNAISVTDVDAGNNSIRVSLTALQGTLSMGSKTGLTFTIGDGTDDATMTFTGTVTAINAGLNGLTYKPTDGFSGTETLEIVSNDNGHSGAGGHLAATTSFTVQVLSGGRFVFNTADYGVNESGGTATITVLRAGGTAGTASVSASTAGGSATAGASCTTGVDYLPKAVTFTWGNGDFSPRQFTISICNDSLVEGDETINLTLDNPTGTGSLGPQSTAILTIGTDDGPVLLFNEATQEAIALDLVNLTRDPFALTDPFNLSTDLRRRISLFVWQAEPLASNEIATVTATARDTEFRVYQLEVEALSPVLLVPGVTQVVVKLPDSVIGTPRELLVKITVKGLTTNEAFIQVTGP